jgi:prephenate dehydratase
MPKLNIAFQGEKGAFSQVAIQQLLGTHARVAPCQRFEEVFQSVADARVDAAVIPIENTLHGSVHENYDHLLNFNLRIVGETNVRVEHNLIARPGVRFRQIRRVYSHPVALNQCLRFFAANPRLERVPFYDTAGSVKMVIENGLEDAAGIASAMSAEIYNGEILKRNIEDDASNFTRFFLLKRPGGKPPKAAGEWRTSLVFRTPNIPGALFRCLSAFAADSGQALGVHVLSGLHRPNGRPEERKGTRSP